MKLVEWLAKQKMNSAEFARIANVGYFGLRKWLDGSRVPGVVFALRIERATNGEVPVESWSDGEFEAAAPARRRAAR